MYRILRNFLFIFPPEFTHTLALIYLQYSYRLYSTKVNRIDSTQNIKRIFNLSFPNRIGLAAGFDKNGDYIKELSALGFGFIEIGTLTPKPQNGNSKPRLFRLPKQQAIINRMGFNNKGIDYAAKRLSMINFQGILGINIGKNRDTTNENAKDDYLYGMRKLWSFASYFVINISSPNTTGLRELQQEKYLHNLLVVLKHEQKQIELNHQKYIPLVVKIAPDLQEDEIRQLANTFLQVGIDGVIATNTSVQRFGISSEIAKQTGGLSGAPLADTSTKVIRLLHEVLGTKVPIIASGGVMDEKTAREKIDAGAKLIQIYTGMIFEGPGLIKRLTSVF